MRLSNLEKKKSILMIVLLLLCVFQMGILWSEKNPGIPFPFSPQMRFWQSSISVDIDEVRGNYYHPETIIVSPGTGDLYWSLDQGSNLYRSIWRDVKDSYLTQILSQKPGEAEQEWEDLTRMKCIILEFEMPLPAGIIRWMAGMEAGLFSTIKSIYKIAIFPSEDINHNKNTLYVFDGTDVFKYVVTIEQGNMKKDNYIKAIDGIHQNESVIPMRRFISLYPSIKDPELLLCLEDGIEKKIWDLLVRTPDEITLKKDNIEKIEDYLLADFRSSMVTNFSADETNIIFSDSEQVIRFYRNGFFDYQYRNKELGEKGLVEEAFEKVITFIEYRRKLINGVEIYLSRIDSTDKNYTFTFNYVSDDMKIKILSERDKKVKPALVVTANRDRVLDVKWYIKTFNHNDFSKHYSLNFFDFYDRQLVLEYPDIEKNPMINDISNAYLYSENGMRAEPYWLVETESKLIYLGMQEKENSMDWSKAKNIILIL